MENLKIVAKHFSRDAKTNLVFQEGVCPSTDGTTIKLPKVVNQEYLDVTVGTVIHETGHIRHTDFEVSSNLRGREFDCLNVLEDIRIDTKVLVEYPNSKYFSDASRDEVIREKLELLKKEPVAVQVLKSLIFSSEGKSPSEIYDNPKTLELFQKYEPLIEVAKKSPDTKSLIDISKKLSKDLFGDVINEPDKPDGEGGEGKPGKPGQPGKGKQKEGENGSPDGEGQETESSPDGTPKESTSPGDIQKEIDKLENELESIRNKQHEKQQETSNKSDEVTKSRRRYNANHRSADRERRRGNEQKAKNHERLKEKHLDAYNKLLDELNKLRSELESLQEKNYKTISSCDDLKTQIRARENNCFQKNPDANIKGFESLNSEKVQPSDEQQQIQSSASLDQLIADCIIEKRDLAIADDTGHKLNVRKLHNIHVDCDELFIDEETKEYKTKVALILDVSSSMGDCHGGSRSALTVDVCKVIADALVLAKKRGAPLEFNIYGFGRRTGLLVDGDKYKPENLRNQYIDSGDRLGRSTNIVECVNYVTNDLSDGLDSDSDAIAIVITDAQVDDTELTQLTNQANSLDVKFGFVAVCPENSQRNPEFNDLFGDNVIERHDIKSASDIIANLVLTL